MWSKALALCNRGLASSSRARSINFGQLYELQQQQQKQQQKQQQDPEAVHAQVAGQFTRQFLPGGAIFRVAAAGANSGTRPVPNCKYQNSSLARAYALLYLHVQTQTPFKLYQPLPDLDGLTLEHLAAVGCMSFMMREVASGEAVLSVPPVVAPLVWAELPPSLVLAKQITARGNFGLADVGFAVAGFFSLRTQMLGPQPLSGFCSALREIVPQGSTQNLGEQLVSLQSTEPPTATLEAVLAATVGLKMANNREFAGAPSNCLWKGHTAMGSCADLYIAAKTGTEDEEVLIALQFKSYTADGTFANQGASALNDEMEKTFPEKLRNARPQAKTRVLLIAAPFLSTCWSGYAGKVLTGFVQETRSQARSPGALGCTHTMVLSHEQFLDLVKVSEDEFCTMFFEY